MEHFIKRNEATAYPEGMRFRHKQTGTEYIIEKQCVCGDWLHYNCKQLGEIVKSFTWHHHSIQMLCEIIPDD